MTLKSFREFLIQQINQIDPTIDTSVGSNFRDLMINPVSEVFTGFATTLADISNRLNIEDIGQLSPEELNSFGKQFLVERSTGTHAVGKIRLYFNQPQAVVLQPNSLFKTTVNTVLYHSLNYYQISKFTMSQNFDVQQQLYFTDEITISSLSKTDDSSLGLGTLILSDKLNPSPVKIEVTTPVAGGTAEESDEEFLERIKNSIKTSSLASENVLKAKIMESSGVSIVDIVGAGDPFMKRDLVEYAPLTGKTVENFQYVLSGTSNDLKSKGHSAFVNNFVVSAVTSSGSGADVVWPTSPQSWTNEFSDSLYRGIYTLDDGDFATQDQYQIVSVPAWSEDYFEEMKKADGTEPKNLLIWADEIRLDGSQVILGKTPTSIDFKNVQIPVNQLQQVKADLESAVAAQDWAAVLQLSSLLEQKTLPESYANLSPVFYKKIGQHTGITIDTRMSTTDGTPWGEMAYVTVLRNDQIHMAHDGYGLAWRKQPDFLIRLNYDNYSDPAQKEQDIQTFKELFDVDPVALNLIGSDILRTGSGNDQYWLYNVYLVDNNVLQEETFVGTNRVFDSINGINQYLQRGKYWIEPSVLYDFKIEIQTTLATNIYVKPALGGSFTLVASKGATYPSYVPASGYKIVTGNSQVNALDAEAGNVGIAVGETKGWEWIIHDFFVRSIVQTFPMHLFKFKIDLDKWSEGAGSPFSVDYWGVGYDPNKYILAGYTGNSRTQAAIWKPGTATWELIGTSLATIGSSLDAKKITKEFANFSNYIDVNGYIYIAASAANFGTSYSDNVDHNLISYYVQLSNPEAGEKHLGNMVDAWCFEPSSISEKAVQGIVTNGAVTINEPYICDIVEVREELSQVVIPETDYVIYNSNPRETGSAQNQIKLLFSGSEGMSVTAIVRKWENGPLVGAFLADPENKYPATSIKEKAAPLAVVTINSLEFSGSLDLAKAKETIKNLINSNTSLVLEKSDLVAALYQEGADYVNLDMEIDIKVHDYQMSSTLVQMGNRYTLENRLTKFFTEIELLEGVIKI